MRKKINYFDKNIHRKSEIISNSLQFFPGTKIPMPSLVEVSDSGTCNRKCSFCPRSAEDFKDIKEFIPTRLIEKLISELKEYNFKGTIRFSGFVEPLLDKNIFNLVKFKD